MAEGMSHEQLAQIINRSKILCSEQGAKMVNSYSTGSNNTSNNFRDINPNTYSDNWDNISLSDLDNIGDNQQSYQPSNLSYTNEGLKRSNLPDAIKQSFIDNPIDNEDEAFNKAMNEIAQKANNRKSRQQLVETPMRTTNVQQGNMIDYNYLKYIISECISDYFQKNPIENSGYLKQIRLFKGKIKILDNNGNIFSAKLEKEGNISDMKKEK